ncbi:MAG: Secreted protein [Microgenomates bacterium 39_6]|nr:MAG: Secreted protein [Microgenomates bacterium 39_6]
MKIKLPNLKIFKKKDQENPQPGIKEVSIGKTNKNKKKKTLLFCFLGVLVVLAVLAWFFALSPVLALKNNLEKGQVLATEAKQGLAEKNLSFLKEKISQGEDLLFDSRQEVKRMAWLKIIPIANKYFANLDYSLLAAEKLVDVGRLTIDAVAPYADILGFKQEDNSAEKEEEKTQDRIQFLMETGPELAKNIDDIAQDVKEAKELLAEVDTKYLPEDFRGQPIRSYFISLKEILEENLTFISGLKPALENLPYFLGQDGTRTYLVIFQNDSELRPSGGFLTAYAILEVENGQVTPVLSQDIYDLDARFGRRIEAPRPIAEHLPNVYYWNLRDMNLSPDFTISMNTFYQHYQTIPGAREVEGILAVDTKFLSSLLEVLGPIGVAGWGDFSAEPDDRCGGCPQVVYQLESIITRPLGTLVSDRKAVIGPLMHSILLNMTGSPAKKIPDLFQAIIGGIRQKNVLFYALEEDKQAAIEGLDMSGRIKDFPQGDYFLLNDTNFAGAKSNLFIEQEIEQKFIVDKEGKITKEIKIKYANPAPASDCNLESGGLCLNGLYRNWFRIYVPQGSRLIEMKGSETEPLVYEELGKTVFEGFYGDKYPLYPDGGTNTISLKYQLPFKYDSSNKFLFLIQKQPGTKNHPYRVCWNDDCQEFNLEGDKVLDF